MAYKRQISYFDYMEYGEKKGNGGFCKWEQKKEMHTLEISLNMSKQNIEEKVKIFTRNNMELGEVQLREGRAQFACSRSAEEGNWEWEFSHIRIPLSDERELFAEFPVEESVAKQATVKDNVAKQETVKNNVPKQATIKDNVPKQASIKEPELPDILEEIVIKQKVETVVKEPEVVNKPEIESNVLEEKKTTVSLWEWFEKEHEKMHPFGTSDEYFRIAVEDIYRLHEEYHILRNNQFLLHGYYNYKYLILGKKEMDSEEYWLGVPGIYHEREKMAARMYGFEKFEGSKRRYGVGDFGYYLITVK